MQISIGRPVAARQQNASGHPAQRRGPQRQTASDSLHFTGQARRKLNVPMAFLALLGLGGTTLKPAHSVEPPHQTQLIAPLAQPPVHEGQMDLRQQVVLEMVPLLSADGKKELEETLRQASGYYGFPLVAAVIPDSGANDPQAATAHAERVIRERTNFDSWTGDGGAMLLMSVRDGQPYVSGVVMAEPILRRFPNNNAAREFALKALENSQNLFARFSRPVEGSETDRNAHAINVAISNLVDSVQRQPNRNARRTMTILKPLVVAVPFKPTAPEAPRPAQQPAEPITPPAQPAPPTAKPNTLRHAPEAMPFIPN